MLPCQGGLQSNHSSVENTFPLEMCIQVQLKGLRSWLSPQPRPSQAANSISSRVHWSSAIFQRPKPDHEQVTHAWGQHALAPETSALSIQTLLGEAPHSPLSCFLWLHKVWMLTFYRNKSQGISLERQRRQTIPPIVSPPELWWPQGSSVLCYMWPLQPRARIGRVNKEKKRGFLVRGTL